MLSYNRSTEYLNTVRSWFSYYQRGTHEVPDGVAKTLPTTPSTPLPTLPGPRPGSGPSVTPSPKPSPSKL